MIYFLGGIIYENTPGWRKPVDAGFWPATGAGLVVRESGACVRRGACA